MDPWATTQGYGRPMTMFEPVLEALTTAGVRFVVVGGVAVVLHGHPRFTADLDMVIDLAPDQAQAAVDALTGLGFRPRLPVDPRDFADPATRRRWVKDRGLTAFSFHNPDNPLLEVDLFAEAPIDFEALWARAVTMALGSLTVRVASIEDLILMKERAGRPQDIADLQVLRRLGEDRG
jgi:predicted nucleotidyltransferase